jgi:hypothetical protein
MYVSRGTVFSSFNRGTPPIHYEFINKFINYLSLSFEEDLIRLRGFLHAPEMASKGYAPMVKPGGVSPGGYGARMRDGLFDESLYRLRAVGEGIFGALTMEFGDRMRTRRKESSETRILLRLMVYYLKVVARWLHG